MLRYLRNKPLMMFTVGISAGLLVGVGMMIGFIVAWTGAAPSAVRTDEPSFVLPEDLLHASSAYGGKQMAMATGTIYEGAEGLFVLDFLTGDLYCWVLNPRSLTTGYIGIFKTNVVKDLGIEKGKAPDYMLVTGSVSSLRGSGGGQPANCVCYVGDGSTGNVAAYSLAYNRTYANSGRPQQGELIRLALGKARPNIEREQ